MGSSVKYYWFYKIYDYLFHLVNSKHVFIAQKETRNIRFFILKGKLALRNMLFQVHKWNIMTESNHKLSDSVHL